MKLFIGVCNSQDSVPGCFFWSFVGLKNKYSTEIYRSTHPWDVVRNNRIIDKFLRSDCDVLAKMDIDQLYPRNYITSMMQNVERFKVVGPLIYDRWAANKFMPLMFDNVNENFMPLEPMDISSLTGIVKVPYAHTNLFYTREVLESIPAPWYEAYATSDGLDRKNHVDFAFLDKINRAGFSVHIDLNTVVNHQTERLYATEKLRDVWQGSPL